MKSKNPSIVIQAFQDGDDESGFIPVLPDENDDFQLELPDDRILPILALRNIVLFPGVVMPINVGRKKSLRLVREMYKKEKPIGTLAQIDKNTNDPTADDLYKVGTIAQIIRVLEMPDNTTTVILQGRATFDLEEMVSDKPYLQGLVSVRSKSEKPDSGQSFKALVEAIRDLAGQIVQLSNNLPQEIAFAFRNIEDAEHLINFVAANFGINLAERQKLLDIQDLEERAIELHKILTRKSQLLQIKSSIQSKAMENIDKQQRDYFLQQQIKTIQKELGNASQEQEIGEMRQKANKKHCSEEVRAKILKEITKLEGMHSAAPDFPIQQNYVQTLLDLPWDDCTKDNLKLSRAERILNRDHFGLDDVKERILEHLAVLKLKGDLKSPILCLYGPPGVGKTSLGKSIAESLGRKYARISLGGLHDEAEIRGHRKTYIGAMPGRIIQNLLKVGSSNPVFILDEIDKIGADFKGDPSSALLEVLDPEQNNTFHDNFIDMDYDLSKVLFIATANSLSEVSRPLLDRMELINISGYLVEEKIEIAHKYLVPKELANHGIPVKAIKFPKPTLRAIIEGYTREAGVRGLEKCIAKIARKLARKVADNPDYTTEIKTTDLKELLGVHLFDKDLQSAKEEIGIVTGLAWTSVGGEILEIETSISKGKGEKLTLTGNLGDVMKESATLGLEYIKAHAEELGIDDKFFSEHNIHIHVPEGAIPKDGPSAGITMATSLLSAIANRKVRKHIAMTGEITLHGKVLPVGGIKEKILAAKRAGVTDILLCASNQKDIEEIKPIYVQGVTFHYVKNVQEVFDFALLPAKK